MLMFAQIFCVISIFLLSHATKVEDEKCIEPRNHYAEDSIVDIQWSRSDTTLYVSTMGRVSVYELDGDHSPVAIREVCDGRFPEIAVTNSAYAIGSDFLPILSIYDSKTNSIIHELDIHSENVRSVGFSNTGDLVVVSKSNYDEDGFFDIDRNVEVWDLRTGRTLAEFITEADRDSLYLPFNAGVSFESADVVLVRGIDYEDAWVSSQPIVYVWNWRTDEVDRVDIEANTLIEAIGASKIVVLDPVGDREIKLQMINLLPNFEVEQAQSYDIEIKDLSMTRLSASVDQSLLAIENQEGHIWIVNLATQKIVSYREFETFANTIAFDHAGQRLALGYSDGSIDMWDLRTETLMFVGNVFSQ